MSLRRRSDTPASPPSLVGTARGDHGSNAVSETRERDHGHVDHEKKHEETGREKMNCASRLLPAEDCDDRGYDRHDGGRHGEAREDDQRKKHENDCKVGEPLDNVVTLGLGVAGGLQAQMIRNDTRDGTPAEIRLAWQQILAEVLGEKAGESVNQAGQDANPGGEKMQGPAPARRPAYPETKRKIKYRGSPHATCFAPIKTRMSHEYGDATDDKSQKAEGMDPVSDADQGRVPRRIQNV